MVGLKRTYRKVILREVRFSLSRFLAIFAIVALGVGFLAGLLAAEIGAVALAWGLGVVWPPEIDRINILQATLKAMCHAASVLKVRPKGLLIDGNQTIPEPLFRQRAACWPASPRQKSIVDGDALVPVISAASIIAKTFRDMLMDKLDHRYPGYGFAKHKGYGSKEHFAALRELGPCPMHRKTFRGVLPERQTARQGSLL